MFGCDGLFYYPNARSYGRPEQQRLTYESVRFSAPGGPRLHGWFFPAQLSKDAPRPVSLDTPREPDRAIPDGAHGSEQSPAHGIAQSHARGTVLHIHGNAGNITGHFQHVAWLPSAGWNVLCFDYRGYGQSEGKMTRAGSIADAHAALDYLLTRGDVDHARIVSLGQSLGGAVGIVLAAERPEIRALAVDGAFDNYRRIVAWHIRHSPLLLPIAWWVPRMLIAEGYDPIDYVARIAPRPIFIMHGTADRVVDPAMAKRLYDAAREPKELWLAPNADHYEAMQEHAEEARPRLVSFFERSLAAG
jgi:uncharacterized protein